MPKIEKPIIIRSFFFENISMDYQYLKKKSGEFVYRPGPGDPLNSNYL